MKIYFSSSSQTNSVYAWGGTAEQVQCNRIADYARKALAKNGYNAKEALAEHSGKKNAAKSNKWGADLHIPVHIDAGGDEGTAVFTYPGSGSNDYTRSIYEAVAAIRPNKASGIRETSNLYENKEASGMCVYIECEFHDGPFARWIVDNVRGLGEAIAKGICKADGKGYIPLTGNEFND